MNVEVFKGLRSFTTNCVHIHNFYLLKHSWACIIHRSHRAPSQKSWNLWRNRHVTLAKSSHYLIEPSKSTSVELKSLSLAFFHIMKVLLWGSISYWMIHPKQLCKDTFVGYLEEVEQDLQEMEKIAILRFSWFLSIEFQQPISKRSSILQKFVKIKCQTRKGGVPKDVKR